MLGLIIVLLSWIDSSRGEKVQINAQAPMVLVTASYGCYISKGGVYLETHLSVCFIYTPKVQSRIVPYDNAMQCGPYLSAIFPFNQKASTYDHRVWKTGLPVRSAVLKPHASARSIVKRALTPIFLRNQEVGLVWVIEVRSL